MQQLSDGQTRRADLDVAFQRYQSAEFVGWISPAETRCPALLDILIFVVRLIVGEYIR